MNTAIPSTSTKLEKLIFVSDCICLRPKRMVLCTLCNLQIHGRVYQMCNKHPKTVFLNDMSQCPNCKTYNYMVEI